MFETMRESRRRCLILNCVLFYDDVHLPRGGLLARRGGGGGEQSPQASPPLLPPLLLLLQSGGLRAKAVPSSSAAVDPGGALLGLAEVLLELAEDDAVLHLAAGGDVLVYQVLAVLLFLVVVLIPEEVVREVHVRDTLLRDQSQL